MGSFTAASMRKAVHVVLAVGLPFAGCVGVHDDQLSIEPVVQTDAPVQIVSIQSSGDNLLATVTVKNMTDRPIDGFDIGWSIFRPLNCGVSGAALQLQLMGGETQSAHAEARGIGRWRSRVLKPHEETEITTVSLSRKELMKMAKDFNAKKVRVQVGIAYANYPPERGATYHVGPDWRNVTWEQAGNIFDVEDEARQACN